MNDPFGISWTFCDCPFTPKTLWIVLRVVRRSQGLNVIFWLKDFDPTLSCKIVYSLIFFVMRKREKEILFFLIKIFMNGLKLTNFAGKFYREAPSIKCSIRGKLERHDASGRRDGRRKRCTAGKKQHFGESIPAIPNLNP